MAACKDCLHVEVCEDITRHKLSPSIAEEILPILREHGKTCEQFKDRSRFVELPCKTGDMIYRICPVNEGDECCNCPWEFCDCYDIGFQCSCPHNSIKVICAGDSEWIMKRTPYFGEIYFLTLDTAEQALKERESNAQN